jgi:hypothetical protein
MMVIAQPVPDRPMTVLQIRPADHGCDVIFAESARFYQLRADQPDYDSMRQRLASSLGRVVWIRLNEPHGHRIEAVRLVP